MQIYQRFEILLWNIAIPFMRALAAVRQSFGAVFPLPRWETKKLAWLVTAVLGAAVLGIGLRAWITPPHTTGSAPILSPWKPDEQRNLLVIGVDQLNSSQPVLESAWLVLYNPGVPHFSFVPLYPIQDESHPDFDQAIQLAFKVNSDKTPNAAFLHALRSSGAWWDHYVLLDELALAEIIDLGASPNLPERITGLQLVANSLDVRSTGSTLTNQAGLITAVCRGFDYPAIPQDIGAYIAGFSDHLRTDMKPKEILGELRWLNSPESLASSAVQDSPSTQPELSQPLAALISCEFPTINNEITYIGGQVGYP
jgi:hypothetical protein